MIHPYKNVLMKKDKLQRLLNSFIEKLLEIISQHPNLRINLTLPGYLLERCSPVLLSKLNEFQKSDCLEWLTPGYTEPFVTFSPLWLSHENIQYGLEIFQDHVGIKPRGYVPAFSNWEPAAIRLFLENGIHYTVLSRTLLPDAVKTHLGYWITEHTGHAIIIIPAHTFHPYNTPSNILTWLERTGKRAHDSEQEVNLITLDYRIPLEPPKNPDPFKWLSAFTSALDTVLLTYELHLLHELPGRTPPLGLHHIPSSIEFKGDNGDFLAPCANFLHTFDCVGILQRKMMDIADHLESQNAKDVFTMKKQLFFMQDVNRYLPHTASGFPHIKDRFWSFSQLIDIEREILKKNKITGGQVRIADLLKNGTKSILMSNKNIKVCIDHKNGGQVFELDYRERSANLFTAYNPRRHTPPRILVAGKSRTSFIDHFLNEKCTRTDFINNTAKHYGDFVTGQFEYKVKKTATSIKTILSRQGFITIQDKQYPLIIEKVFGLEKDRPELSFVYQLSHHSLITYAFTFAIELTFGLPGVQSHQAEIVSDKITHNRLAWDRVTFKNTTEWTLTDKKIGVAVTCITQKPVTVWCYPIIQSSPYQGTAVVISTPVSLEENSAWSLMGKLSCKKIALKGDSNDVI